MFSSRCNADHIERESSGCRISLFEVSKLLVRVELACCGGETSPDSPSATTYSCALRKGRQWSRRGRHWSETCPGPTREGAPSRVDLWRSGKQVPQPKLTPSEPGGEGRGTRSGRSKALCEAGQRQRATADAEGRHWCVNSPIIGLTSRLCQKRAWESTKSQDAEGTSLVERSGVKAKISQDLGTMHGEAESIRLALLLCVCGTNQHQS